MVELENVAAQNSSIPKELKKINQDNTDLGTKINQIASIPRFNSSVSIIPPVEPSHLSPNPPFKTMSHSNSVSHSEYSNPQSQAHSGGHSFNSNSNSASESNSNSNTNTNTNTNSEKNVGMGMSKKHSFGSFSNNASNNLMNFRTETQPGIRTSMMSEYSGVVQHVDIDTIKFVGNKESLQLSQIHGTSSSSEDSLVSGNHINDKTKFHNKNTNADFISSSKISPSKNDDLEIPARSRRRPTLTNLDSDNIIKVIKTKNDISPNKRAISSPPPRSPLPKPSVKMSTSTSSSPLRGKHSRNTSMSSDASLKLHGRLDDIMKEVENLKLEFQDEPPIEEEKKRFSNAASSYSMSSTINSAYTANSFHTAKSESFDSQSSERRGLFEDFVEEPTENLNIGTSHMDLDPSVPKIKHKSLESSSKDPDLVKPAQVNEDGTNLKSENRKSQQKKVSSHSRHNRHNKTASSSKSKRKSTSSKNKIRPFSYETLAKLLNATDGIIIGQEFATLNIPAEEKFLIERIVDSISRLTANMMLNPARYEQSCARLEHVLNVLEGFD